MSAGLIRPVRIGAGGFPIPTASVRGHALKLLAPHPTHPKEALLVGKRRVTYRGLSRLNFVLVLVPGGWFALKIGRRGRRFFSDTGDQREKKHDEARYDKRGPPRLSP